MATIQGTAGDDASLTGTSGNDFVYGYGGNDTLDGGDGNDVLYAGDGTDTLYGGAGNDQLDGGTGADVMDGGDGNDTYYVDDVGDTVIEGGGALGGIDTVNASISYTLGANVERLTLTGVADLDGTGNSLANVIKGNAGNNILSGGAGNDSIDGGDGNDTILGGSGNDVLTGGLGTDTLSYADAGSAVNVSLAILVNQNTGGSGIDKVSGFENLTGSDYNDVLIGDAGNNTIRGGLGVDAMSGGGGNDKYYVDNVGDTVTENSGEGTDLVLSTVSFTLGANVENLQLLGSDAINGTGNDLDNIIRGNDAGNVINGKGGHDSLYGSAAADTFVFDAPDASSSDIVHDFVSGLDTIQVSGAAFGLSAGPLDSSYFVSGSAATAAHAQFIFDSHHNLYFDADGTGAGAAVLVAGFGTSTVASTDIIVGP
jgi:Ca2+-binding RTX toxin-like protein